MLCWELETLHDDFSSCEFFIFVRMTFFCELLLFAAAVAALLLRKTGSSEPLAYLGRSMGCGITFLGPLLAPIAILSALPPEELLAY